MIPAGKQQAVLDALDAEQIDYALSDETSSREYTAVVSFPVPTGAVEPVLERLREAGIQRDAYTVVVNAETVVSDRFDELAQRYADNDDHDEDRIAREELASQAAGMVPETGSYLILTVISAVVATAGLLLDSPAVVVGSMVIAPLLGPAMATSVGTVVADDELFRRGVYLQVVGGVVAVVAAAGFAATLRYTGVVSLSPSELFATDEIAERLTADVLALPVALGAGVAGALSLSSGVSAALVGVMIAAALVPPTAVVGIGLAWGQPTAVVGAAVLVVLNFLSINFTAVGTLWSRGYQPYGLFTDAAERTTRRRIAALGLAVLLVSSVLVVASVVSAQQHAFESTAREETQRLLADTDAQLLELTVSTDGTLFAQPSAVSVTVGLPPDTVAPSVSQPLADRLADDVPERRLPGSTTGPLRVHVQFVTLDTAQAE